MIKLLRRLVVPLSVLFFLPTTAFASDLSTPSGPVILTVAGKIDHANRPAFNPDEDAFLKYHEKTFEKAADFDMAMLEALGMHQITADMEGWPSTARFEGPWLKDVLAAAGAKGDTFAVLALDAYGGEITRDELDSQNWIFALKRGGKYLNIAQKGPAWIAYERADGKQVSADEEGKWVWNVFYIEVN